MTLYGCIGSMTCVYIIIWVYGYMLLYLYIIIAIIYMYIGGRYSYTILYGYIGSITYVSSYMGIWIYAFIPIIV